MGRRSSRLHRIPPRLLTTKSLTADDEIFDTVLDELKRWEDMGLKEYYIAEDRLLNEFKMMWALRESFPLHFIVFKQTACHLAHEANVEQVFSRARLLADPNLSSNLFPAHLAHLATLVMVGFNQTTDRCYQGQVLRDVPQQEG